MIPVAYLLMAGGLISFASMGIIHKLGDRTGARPLGLTVVAMAAAASASFLYTAFIQGNAIGNVPRSVVLLALPFGASAALGLWFFQKGLRYGRISTSWLLINLSTGIPTVLSIVFYKEPLTFKKLIVFVMVIGALFLLWWDRREQAEGGG